jgi:tetratricopeptide (TPR) repeat protein
MTTSARTPARPVGKSAPSTGRTESQVKLEALKKKAFELEQKKKFDHAIAVYREVLHLYDTGTEPNIDIALYNRVADLLVRQENTPDAVVILERAVELYIDGGFFNKASALCNKILRLAPGRAYAYYKLGKISAANGMMSEARTHFLEYADRMQKAGKVDEAFRALKEFEEMVQAVEDRVKAVDSLVKPQAGAAGNGEMSRELVFIEVGAPIMEKPRPELIFIDVNAPHPFNGLHQILA